MSEEFESDIILVEAQAVNAETAVIDSISDTEVLSFADLLSAIENLSNINEAALNRLFTALNGLQVDNRFTQLEQFERSDLVQAIADRIVYRESNTTSTSSNDVALKERLAIYKAVKSEKGLSQSESITNKRTEQSNSLTLHQVNDIQNATSSISGQSVFSSILNRDKQSDSEQLENNHLDKSSTVEEFGYRSKENQQTAHYQRDNAHSDNEHVSDVSQAQSTHSAETNFSQVESADGTKETENNTQNSSTFNRSRFYQDNHPNKNVKQHNSDIHLNTQKDVYIAYKGALNSTYQRENNAISDSNKAEFYQLISAEKAIIARLEAINNTALHTESRNNTFTHTTAGGESVSLSSEKREQLRETNNTHAQAESDTNNVSKSEFHQVTNNTSETASATSSENAQSTSTQARESIQSHKSDALRTEKQSAISTSERDNSEAAQNTASNTVFKEAESSTEAVEHEKQSETTSNDSNAYSEAQRSDKATSEQSQHVQSKQSETHTSASISQQNSDTFAAVENAEQVSSAEVIQQQLSSQQSSLNNIEKATKRPTSSATAEKTKAKAKKKQSDNGLYKDRRGRVRRKDGSFASKQEAKSYHRSGKTNSPTYGNMLLASAPIINLASRAFLGPAHGAIEELYELKQEIQHAMVSRGIHNKKDAKSYVSKKLSDSANKVKKTQAFIAKHTRNTLEKVKRSSEEKHSINKRQDTHEQSAVSNSAVNQTQAKNETNNVENTVSTRTDNASTSYTGTSQEAISNTQNSNSESHIKSKVLNQESDISQIEQHDQTQAQNKVSTQQHSVERDKRDNESASVSVSMAQHDSKSSAQSDVSESLARTDKQTSVNQSSTLENASQSSATSQNAQIDIKAIESSASSTETKQSSVSSDKASRTQQVGESFLQAIDSYVSKHTATANSSAFNASMMKAGINETSINRTANERVSNAEIIESQEMSTSELKDAQSLSSQNEIVQLKKVEDAVENISINVGGSAGGGLLDSLLDRDGGMDRSERNRRNRRRPRKGFKGKLASIAEVVSDPLSLLDGQDGPDRDRPTRRGRTRAPSTRRLAGASKGMGRFFGLGGAGAMGASTLASGASVGTGILRMGAMASKAIPILAAATTAYDAYSGFTDEGKQREAFGLTKMDEPTLGHKSAMALGSVLDLGGLTSGAAGLLGSGLEMIGFEGAKESLTFDSTDIAKSVYDKVSNVSSHSTGMISSLFTGDFSSAGNNAIGLLSELPFMSGLKSLVSSDSEVSNAQSDTKTVTSSDKVNSASNTQKLDSKNASEQTSKLSEHTASTRTDSNSVINNDSTSSKSALAETSFSDIQTEFATTSAKEFDTKSISDIQKETATKATSAKPEVITVSTPQDEQLKKVLTKLDKTLSKSSEKTSSTNNTTNINNNLSVAQSSGINTSFSDANIERFAND
ncbi:hypothetical protein [Pseudoalteromonas sp. Of7M-16]|uniref:hypothetical protein n=1 Tax=Pseudoalteromonas sp. Of7M-16 TaxID=2917756 RepID=UPI001EF58509|nr:hypothetical protein [Pseudoalteromonas sp. Of7M-16]MCG7550943.1 hypothetical protein [Pseudoalteromonas sp. Of7M-16]